MVHDSVKVLLFLKYLLGIYPKERKTYVHTKRCTLNDAHVLFATSRSPKQSKCPSKGEWINYGLSIHGILLLKKIITDTPCEIVNFKIITLNETSQTKGLPTI